MLTVLILTKIKATMILCSMSFDLWCVTIAHKDSGFIGDPMIGRPRTGGDMRLELRGSVLDTILLTKFAMVWASKPSG